MAKTFEGRAVKPKSTDDRLNVRHAPSFIFMHHPNQWDLLESSDGFELLPKLTKFQLIAGLNGVKSRPGGGVDATVARVAMMDKGWVFVDSEKGGDGGYLREFDGIRGLVYADKWATPRRLGGGTMARVVWDHDTAGFDAFRRSLLEDGTIKNPDNSILDFMITLKEKRIQRKTKTAHIPHVQKQIKEIEDEKEALETVKKTKKTKVKKAKKAKKADA